MDTIPIDLGCRPPHPKQLEFLKIFQRETPGTAITHYVGGRRSGKSVVAVLALLYSALTFNRGLPHLWTSPTHQDCIDTFLRTWEMIVPPNMYSINRQEKTVRIHNTGGSLIDYRSRQVTNTRREGFRGPTYAGAILDEPRQDPNGTSWGNIRATVSDPRASQLWMATSSTPRMNWYHDLVVEGGNPVIYGTSFDNPYLDNDYILGLEGDLTPQMARQEVYAEWISMADRVWQNVDLDKEWPDGNIHPHTWDPTLPYTLACDIGLKSAWLIIQHLRGVDVVVGEYTPGREGTEMTISRIEEEYGTPSRVVVGSDWNTGGVVNAQSHAIYFRSRGWATRVTSVPPGTIYAQKHIQYTAANRLTLDARGRRRFCISAGLVSHEPDNKCGIRELFLRDTWPDDNRDGQYLVKDKREKGHSALEDMRDAFLYYAIMVHPVRGHKQVVAA